MSYTEQDYLHARLESSAVNSRIAYSCDIQTVRLSCGDCNLWYYDLLVPYDAHPTDVVTAFRVWLTETGFYSTDPITVTPQRRTRYGTLRIDEPPPSQVHADLRVFCDALMDENAIHAQLQM